MEYTEIGRTIKELRMKRNLSVQELAEKANLTQGYLSKIENSENPPPIPTLIKIAYALKVHVSYFFGEEKEEQEFILVRNGEGKEVIRDFTLVGCMYESILQRKTDETVINVYVLTIPGKIDPDALPYNSHEGKEFLYVLEGDMIFFYGDTNYRIQEGDALYFKANIPHKTI